MITLYWSMVAASMALVLAAFLVARPRKDLPEPGLPGINAPRHDL